jgi:hypothetical protein
MNPMVMPMIFRYRFHLSILSAFLATGTVAAQGPVSTPPAGNATAKPDTARANPAALIYGPRHAFTVHAPDKWTLDNSSGRRQGLQAVFYPNGERWSASPAVIYCQVIPRDQQIKDLAAMLDYDRNRYRNTSPNAVVADLPAVSFPSGKQAAVRRFSGGPSGAIEQTAYIEERTVIVLIILSCRNAEALDRSLPAFTQFVRSYTFLADDSENILRAVEAAQDE